MKRILVFASVLLACGISANGAVSVVQHVHGHSIGLGSTVACSLTATGVSRNVIVATLGTTGGGGDGNAALAYPVSSVTDNIGNTYSQAPGTRGIYEYWGTEVWHSLAATSGVTTVTVTFSGKNSYYRACFAYEVAGILTFDSATQLSMVWSRQPGNNEACVSLTCTGPAITTTTATTFVLAVYGGFPVDQNPIAGNEFTSGGDIDIPGNFGAAAVSLISSTAAAHRPVWHADATKIYLPGQSESAYPRFAASVAAYKQ